MSAPGLVTQGDGGVGFPGGYIRTGPRVIRTERPKEY